MKLTKAAVWLSLSLLLLSPFLYALEFPQGFTLETNGVIRLGNQAINLKNADLGWSGHENTDWENLQTERTDTGFRVTGTASYPGYDFRVEERIQQTGENTYHYEGAFHFPHPVQMNALFAEIRITLPLEKLTLDGQEVKVPALQEHPELVATRKVRTISVKSWGGTAFTVAGDLRLMVQDNRKWGNQTLSIRIFTHTPPLEPLTWKDAEVKFDLKVDSPSARPVALGAAANRSLSDEDGTCGLGIDATYQGYMDGCGVLDLSGVESDTNLRLSSVESYAFKGVTKLVDLILPDSVTSIGEEAFYTCTNLRTVRLPAKLHGVHSRGIAGCPALRKMTPLLPSSIEFLAANAFEDLSSLTGALVLNNPGLSQLYAATFAGCCSLTSIDMGGSRIQTLYSWVFSGCSSVTNVVLGPTLRVIDAYAFQNCTSLQTVTPFLPMTLTSIGSNAFRYCANLSGELTLSNPDFTSIGEAAFGSVAPNLTKITFPDAAFSIGQWAFSGIKPGTPVYFLGQASASIQSGSFLNSERGRINIYACRQLDEEGWTAFAEALTESDLSDATYPGSRTFGVKPLWDVRHWVINWNSPLAYGRYSIFKVH